VGSHAMADDRQGAVWLRNHESSTNDVKITPEPADDHGESCVKTVVN